MNRSLIGLLLGLVASTAMADPLPDGFVRLSALAPGIAQDMRYARPFNFTGAVVPGYEAAECILTRQTAQALIAVEARLAADGFGLIVYDCYRPVRAVTHFADWAEADGAGADGAGQGSGAGFFPGLSRRDLFAKGYIARRSSHSLGVTVDAGLRRKGDPALRPDGMTSPCDADFAQRHRESALDLGTTFDCFSPLSAIGAAVGPDAITNRKILTAAMQSEGFRGYAAEWWHFRNASDPADTPQDFVIR